MSSGQILYTKLGNSDLEVSRIGLGTWKFMNRCDYISARKVMKEAQNSGITLFDTSDNYGPAESWIGRAIKEGELSRDKMVLATKTGLPITQYDNFDIDTSPQRILKQVDRSIEILEAGIIDLYQIHAPDSKVPVADVVTIMNDLMEKKKIRYYGLSNYGTEELTKALMACKEKGLKFPVSLQNMYYMAQFDKDNIYSINLARESGMHILAHSPLGRGFLTERNLGYKNEDVNEVNEIKEELKKPFRKLQELAKQNGRNIQQLALAWLLNQNNTIPLVGAYKVEYLKDAIESLSWKLDDEIKIKIDEARKEAVDIAKNITYQILTKFTIE